MTALFVPDRTGAPLDADLARIQAAIQESGRYPIGFDIPGPEARRRARERDAEFYAPEAFDVASIEDTVIHLATRDIPVRIQRPHEPKGGTVVYFHGGNWIHGDLDSHQSSAARLALRTGATVMQVDYRLAPEHPFPAAVDDACDALKWSVDNVGGLGGDPQRVAVAGDSSGGNLAAVAAQWARDEGILLAAQLLLYPVTFLGDFARELVGRQYLGDALDTVGEDPRLGPAFGRLEGLAPAIVGVGEHDFLYEDNIAYARALADADVAVTLRVFPTLPHGFFGHGAASPTADAAADLLGRDLAGALSEPRTEAAH